jgi:hypothetical protein
MMFILFGPLPQAEDLDAVKEQFDTPKPAAETSVLARFEVLIDGQPIVWARGVPARGRIDSRSPAEPPQRNTKFDMRRGCSDSESDAPDNQTAKPFKS